ncbi:MAG TPA: autotransporter [Vicinamibacteria bacterium]
MAVVSAGQAPAPQAKPAAAQAKPAAAPTAPPSIDGTWPREVKTSIGAITIYQPQVDDWDGATLQFRTAVSVKANAEAPPVYGVVWGTTRTNVDKDSRLVQLHDRKFTKAVFPSATDKQDAWLKVADKEVQPAVKEIALDRLAAALEVAAADKLAAAVPVKNDPPRFLFSTQPAILVYVDGAPVYQPVKDTKLERVINTRVLLLRKGKDHFVKVFDGWLAAESLEGVWSVEKENEDLKKALADAKASGQVDFLPGGNPNDAKTLPSLKSGKVPVLFVATAPSELIVTEGEPQYEPIPGTALSYVKNTTGNMFKDGADQKLYLLVSGRWFRSGAKEGPWQHVASDALPADFAKIPDDSAKENVKAAVAGTTQAKEALIANAIPQTAEVKVKETKIDPPKFDGEVKLAPIEGTSLQYVVNTATPIIRVTDTSWYAVQDAVWFTASGAGGPWAVATSVPTVIYTIPASSPLHYVTYVKIYETKADTVYVGYTPGYYGSCVSQGTVVYGTGYHYPPYVGTTVWYGPPVTYGVGVGMTYTPWTGWTYGFGFGWSWGAVTVGWGWGAYPWWGPVGWGYYYPYPYYRPPYWGGGAAWGPWGGGAVWGPGGWAATSGNVYSRWGATSAVTRRSGGYNAWTGDAWRNSAGMSYNSRTGNLSAGQRSAVGNAYTGNYAYGARGGSVNTRTGGSVSGGRVTGGNVYTGNQATAGRISGTTGSGESGSAAWARGEQGGVARVGDDVYAGKDGNVYKRNGDGGWDQHQPTGSWDRVQDRGSASTLDAQERARSSGATRTQGYDHARASGYGSGYRGGGGYGGGGMRGGGGRRR